MTVQNNIKPLSYVKAKAADILKDLEAGAAPVVITQNGEAKAVLQDIASYEAMQETMALLKLLAIGQREADDGEVVEARAAIEALRSSSRGR